MDKIKELKAKEVFQTSVGRGIGREGGREGGREQSCLSVRRNESINVSHIRPSLPPFLPPSLPPPISRKQDTGDFECQVCGWQYKEEKGFGPYPPGTAFAALPADFK